jgi:hypothetical protein
MMMIRPFILSLMFVGCCFSQAQTGQSGSAETKDPAEVPSLVKDNFTREQPGDAGSWSKDGDNYRVEFVDKESRRGHVIIYDRNGNVVRRDSEVESVPGPINDYYNKNYPGESFRTWSAQDPKGEKYYYSNRQSEVLRFDKEGKPLTPDNGKGATPGGEKKKKGR